MARTGMTIDEKIRQAQEQVIKTKAKYDEAVAILEELLEKSVRCKAKNCCVYSRTATGHMMR